MIVLWRVTTACNLACGFCAYDRRLRLARVQADAGEVERFATLLGEHRAASGEDVLLSWLGGEPLLLPGILPLSRRLREDYGLRTSVTTNGTTLHRPGVAQDVLSSFDEITFSVDGLARTHERLRGWPRGWSRLADGISHLADRRSSRSAPRLRANVVLMRDTLPEFAELCDRLADWGWTRSPSISSAVETGRSSMRRMRCESPMSRPCAQRRRRWSRAWPYVACSYTRMKRISADWMPRQTAWPWPWTTANHVVRRYSLTSAAASPLAALPWTTIA